MRQASQLIAIALPTVLGVAAVVVVLPVHQAVATVSVGSDLHGYYDACIAKFRAAGLGGLVDQLDRSGNTFDVESTGKKLGSHVEANNNTNKRDGTGTGATLYWNPTDTTAFPCDGVAQDPCATLYHEMRHLVDVDKGKSRDDVACNKLSKVTNAEVTATRAENDYRRTQPGLQDRTQYGPKNDCSELPPENSPCDEPPPYERPGGCNSGCSISNGDPHMTTFDQIRYDFQAVGEFVAVRAQARDLEVQARQTALPGSRQVSVNQAVAAKIGNDRVSIYMTQTGLEVHRNGSPVRLASLSRPLELLDDGSVGITWPDGSQLVVHSIGMWGLSLTMSLAPARHGKVTGLFGNFDGDRSNDLVVRGGATLPLPPRFSSLYPAFADSWRITQAESLFDYHAGESTATFTDRTFPAQDAAVASLPDRTAAEAVCRGAGVTDHETLQNCVLDVALSGQSVFANDAAEIQGSLVDTLTTTLTVPPRGGTATMTFHGTAGQKVFIDVPSSSVPNQCGVLTLQAPDNQAVAAGCIIDGNGFIDASTLPATGTYTVVIAPNGTGSGVSRVRVLPITDDVGSLGAGREATVTVAGPGAVGTRTFTGTAGEMVSVEVLSATVPDECGVISLVGPDGTIVVGCIIRGTGSVDATTLSVSGIYTVVVNPGGRNTGTVHWRITPVKRTR